MSGLTSPRLLLVFVSVLVPLLGGVGGAGAQVRERSPLVLDLPASTRALALGNAFVLGQGDSDAIFYHPGDLSRAGGMSASHQRFAENGALTALSAGRSWFGGGVALGLQHLSYEAPVEPPVTAADVRSLSADEGDLRREGRTGISETVVSAGYGGSLLGIRAGVVGKLVEQRVGHLEASTAAADLGLAISPGPLTVGLAARNVGPALSMGGGEVCLPVHFTLGASSRRAPVGPLDVGATGAVDYRLDGDMVPSAGLEVAYWPVTGRTFVARLGYRHRPDDFSASPVTFGGAFLGDDIILEYAFLGFDEGDPSHRFALGWR